MKKGLGLDFGHSRVGLAMGTLLAQELTTVPVEPWKQFIEQILNVIQDNEIDYIVVGVPLSREQSESREFIEDCIEKLKNNIKIQIYETDETLSTQRAEELLAQEGLNPFEIKKRSDQAAAKIILQQYIDENS